MKKRDILIIGALLLAALALYLFAQASLGGEASTVVVTVDGEVVLRKPLAVNDIYEIRQEDGSVNVIVVENGSVYMREANCRDGLCIHQGKMRNAAKTIVCLPHKLTVSLTGEPIDTQNDDLDVIIS